MLFVRLDSSHESKVKSQLKSGTTRGHGKGTVQATRAEERKRKIADAAEEPKKMVANETTDKWFPSAISTEELGRLRA